MRQIYKNYFFSNFKTDIFSKKILKNDLVIGQYFNIDVSDFCINSKFSFVDCFEKIIGNNEKYMLFSNKNEPFNGALAEEFIKAILWMFPAFAIMRGSGAFVQGIGNAKLSMVLAILDGVALRIGLSWFFGIALDLGFFGFSSNS